jgi:hypothetical protein
MRFRLSAQRGRLAEGPALSGMGNANRLKFKHLFKMLTPPIVALPRCMSKQPRRAIFLTRIQDMKHTLRIFLAAFVAAVALAGMPAQGQSSRAIVTFNDPNCASWGMTQSGSNFTLTCQTLLCTITADKPAPLPTDAVVLTAACVGLTGNTFTWTKFSGPAGCPAIASTTATANLAAAGTAVSGCVYKAAAVDPVNGGGSATITLNWSTALPGSPTGCSVAFTTGMANLTNVGGPITMVASCANTNGSTLWAWTKNGLAAGSGTTLSDTLPANTGTVNLTTTYVVTATNAGSTPATVTQPVVVQVAGGSSGIDMSLCTAAGFTGRGVTMNYRLSGNERVLTSNLGNFGNNEAIVVAFIAPAADNTGGAHFTMTYAGGAGQGNKLATLDTKPCSFGTVNSTQFASGNPPATVSVGPSFNLNVAPNGGGVGQTQLQPGITYFITFINRNDYYGKVTSTPSCTGSTCDQFIDSN